jgi:hypothetical protein
MPRLGHIALALQVLRDGQQLVLGGLILVRHGLLERGRLFVGGRLARRTASEDAQLRRVVQVYVALE